MKKQEFEDRWFERAARYPGWHPLPVDRPVHIQVSPSYARSYAGQVATITAASLFGRMSRSVAVEVPALPVLTPSLWAKSTLDEVVLQTLNGSHQYGCYEQRSPRPGDLQLVVGSSGDGLVIHGDGWAAYCGTEPSPIAQSNEPNPFGAAFAVIAAAARLQLDTDLDRFEPVLADTYQWRSGLPSEDAPKNLIDLDIGDVWCIGVGSVGSCALFFLSLVTRAFCPVLIDNDYVKVENVTRSALFSWQDAIDQRKKVVVANDWLRKVGVENTVPEEAWLDEIAEKWNNRNIGTPDILISAANERNVRHVIENGFPPLQVYGTTGRNWQATLFRHIPFKDACSLCVPGGKAPPTPSLCATGATNPAFNQDQQHQDDVALPFLSYAAGIMTAAEITKIAIMSETLTPNRIFFEPRNKDIVRAVELRKKQGCVCQLRNASIHEKSIRGSRYFPLSLD